MINFLSTWIKNLSLVIVVVSILGMLLPNNKTKKYIKMVMGLYVLFSIISPFVKNRDVFSVDVEKIYRGNSIETLSREDENIGTKIQSTDTIKSQNKINSRLEKLYEQKLETDITQKLEKQGYELDKCTVKTYIKDYSKESDENSNTWIEQINIKVSNKSNNKKKSNNYKSGKENAEFVLINEIQKIEKVDVNVLNNNLKDEQTSNSSNNLNEQNSENNNLTADDIQGIKQFLIKEYGVDEKCLKIS